MDKKVLRERRKHFLAFLTALVMIITLMPTIYVASGDEGSGSGSEPPVISDCEHEETTIKVFENLGDKAPTCIAKGLGHLWCTKCKTIIEDGQFDIDYDYTNHVGPYTEEVGKKAATCNEKGYTGDKVCNACNKIAVAGEEITDPDAHDWDEGVVTKEPTCSAKGVKTFTCKNNKNHTKEEEIDIDEDAHDWDEGVVTTEPTCSANGVKTYTCKNNNEHTKEEVILADPTAHTLIHHPAQDPTADADGNLEYWECPDCHKIYTDEEGTEETTPEEVIIPKGEVEPDPEKEKEVNLTGHVFLSGGAHYKFLNAAGTKLCLIDWNGEESEVVIPDTIVYDGRTCKVVSIGDGVFAGKNGITKVIFGENVENIGKEAFKDCKGLTVINAKRSIRLATIGESAFEGCEKLETAILSVDKLQSIGDNAFLGIDPEAAFDMICADTATITGAKALLQNESTGWAEGMTTALFQYNSAALDEYDAIDENTLVINDKNVGNVG